MVPLLLLVAAIGAGARATAGEEERGTLDLLLANPLSRRRLIAEKVAALACEISVLGARCLGGALLVGVKIVGMEISGEPPGGRHGQRRDAGVGLRFDCCPDRRSPRGTAAQQ